MNRPTLRKPPTLAPSVSPRAPDGRDRQVGQQIRRYRLLRRLTQGRVAAQIGISYQQLHKYEDGSSRISMGRLYSLAEVLNVPVTRFLSEDEGPERPPWPASPSPSRQEELLRHVANLDEHPVGPAMGDGLDQRPGRPARPDHPGYAAHQAAP